MSKKSLKKIRKESGESKLVFAKRLGIPYTTYLRYEENLSSAPFSTVAKICDILGISIAEIEC